MLRANHLRRILAIIWLAVISSGLATDDFHAGPLFDRSDLTLSSGKRTEALGPFFIWKTSEGRKQLIIPPLFSHTWYEDVDAEEIDILYPVLTLDRYGREYRWQFIQLFNYSGGAKQDESMIRRFYIFPLYFQQRGPLPEDNYTALVPFYGTIRGKLMRDEVRFVMFPLYGQSRKRDVVTDNYLYPFVHVRRGDGLEGWQFWPFYGAEHKVVTQRTNNFGVVSTIGGHDRTFAMWPIYFKEHNGIGTENPQTNLAVLPFYYGSRSPQRDVTAYLWPLYNHTDDRVLKYREWDFPWPIWVIARGEGKTIMRFIPFYSYGSNATMQNVSIVWPLYRHNLSETADLRRERTRLALWVYSNVEETRLADATTSQRIDCWPLFTRFRNHDGSTRLQILAPLEPVLPNNKNVERNWSPLWTLWCSERNATNGHSSDSLLWNLYRRSSTPETKKCSLLFGLFQYQSTAQETKVRLFFIPFTSKRSSGAPAAAATGRPARPPVRVTARR